MKLVDILARELKVWPDRAESISQSLSGMTFYVPIGGRVHEIERKELSNDWRTSAVTRAQWQAAVDSLTSPEWAGEGLPPVETMCEYQDLDSGKWLRCEVVAHRNNAAVVIGDDYECDLVEIRRLRPIRTPEQIAEDKRLHEIRNALTAIKAGQQHFPNDFVRGNIVAATVEAMIDAGYRKKAPQ